MYGMVRLAWGALLAASLAGQTLPGTEPLARQGDLAVEMVEAMDRWLVQRLQEAPARRDAYWKSGRDMTAERRKLAQLLGARDARVPFQDLSLDAAQIGRAHV